MTLTTANTIDSKVVNLHDPFSLRKKPTFHSRRIASNVASLMQFGNDGEFSYKALPGRARATRLRILCVTCWQLENDC